MSSAPSVLSLVFRGISRGGLDATLPRPRARKSAPRAGENLCEKIRKEPREKWCEKLGGKKRRPPLERGAPFFFNSVGAPFFNPQRGPFFNSRGGGIFQLTAGAMVHPRGGQKRIASKAGATPTRETPYQNAEPPKIIQIPTIFHSATSPA